MYVRHTHTETNRQTDRQTPGLIRLYRLALNSGSSCICLSDEITDAPLYQLLTGLSESMTRHTVCYRTVFSAVFSDTALVLMFFCCLAYFKTRYFNILKYTLKNTHEEEKGVMELKYKIQARW